MSWFLVFIAVLILVGVLLNLCKRVYTLEVDLCKCNIEIASLKLGLELKEKEFEVKTKRGDDVEMSGKLLIFDKMDKCNRVFPKDCNLTMPDRVPVTFGFSRKPEDVVGHADVIKTSDGVNCDAKLYLNCIIDDELYIGGYYNKISSHTDSDGTIIIDSANLCGIGVIPKDESVDPDMKMTLKGDFK